MSASYITEDPDETPDPNLYCGIEYREGPVHPVSYMTMAGEAIRTGTPTYRWQRHLWFPFVIQAGAGAFYQGKAMCQHCRKVLAVF